MSLEDRGLHYGDGLFETIAFPHSKIHLKNHPFLAKHFRRLQSGCDRLNLSYPSDELLLDDMAILREQYPSSIIKILVTRSQSERGYKATSFASNRILIAMPYDFEPARTYRVKQSSLILSEQPFLAGLKHLSRLEQVIASRDADASTEVVLCHQDGTLVEGSKTNLCVLFDEWLTPKLDRAGVCGIVRDWLLHGAANCPSVRESTISYEECHEAKAMLLCNSALGVCAVSSLDGKPLDTTAVEPFQKAWLKVWSC